MCSFFISIFLVGKYVYLFYIFLLYIYMYITMFCIYQEDSQEQQVIKVINNKEDFVIYVSELNKDVEIIKDIDFKNNFNTLKIGKYLLTSDDKIELTEKYEVMNKGYLHNYLTFESKSIRTWKLLKYSCKEFEVLNELTDFEFNTMTKNPAICILGDQKNIVRDILKSLNTQDGFVNNILNVTEVLLNEDRKSMLEQMNTTMESKEGCIIINNCMSLIQGDPIFENLLLNGKFYLPIIVIDENTNLPPYLKSNFDYIFVSSFKDEETEAKICKEIWSQYDEIFDKYVLFKRVYDNLIKHDCVMVFNGYKNKLFIYSN
jgi:hypothetical protein